MVRFVTVFGMMLGLIGIWPAQEARAEARSSTQAQWRTVLSKALSSKVLSSKALSWTAASWTASSLNGGLWRTRPSASFPSPEAPWRQRPPVPTLPQETFPTPARPLQDIGVDAPGLQDPSAHETDQDPHPEPRTPASDAQTAPPARGKSTGTAVNLNTATAAELEELPGIGASTAARIIEYRQKNGAFKKIEDLMNVRGIGEKSFLKLKPLITVTPAKADRGAGASHG